MTSARPTVAVVGLGYGRAHIPAFQAHGCPVVAVCQRDQAVASAVAKAYGVPRVFARWQDMLEAVRPEIVAIATPPHLHRDIARAALSAGAHVLCEKPLATSVAQAREMVEAARRAGRAALTAFNWRFPAAMQRFHARVPDLGRLFHVTARWMTPRYADEGAPSTWRQDRAQAGHGVMGDAGVHLVDLIQWHFGPIARVCAQAGVGHPSRTMPGSDRPADAEDFCGVLATLRSGAHVTLTASRVALGLNEHTLEAQGERGGLAYRLARDTERWYEGALRASAGGGAPAPVPAEPAGPPLTDSDPLDIIGKATIAPLVAGLLRAIDTGETAAPSFEDGLRAQAVLDAIAESARRGAWVDVAG
jgi:predicted dehydrogenase